MARAVYHADNGVERVKEFYFAGEYCFLYLNWLTNTPADYSLQMIAAGETTEIPLALLDAPENQDIKTQLLVQQLIYKEKRANAAAQYPRATLSVRTNTLPGLGVTAHPARSCQLYRHYPVSLSRIRQRLNKG